MSLETAIPTSNSFNFSSFWSTDRARRSQRTGNSTYLRKTRDQTIGISMNGTLTRCSAPAQEVRNCKVDSAIQCEPCQGVGWLICDFCKGQKTDVKAENRRTYRRCPSCRAMGYVVCTECKVFKCVTFPNFNDGEALSF